MNKALYAFALSIGLSASSDFYAAQKKKPISSTISNTARQLVHSGALKNLCVAAVALANTYQTAGELSELKDGFSSTKYLAGLIISISGTWEAYEKFYKTALREKKEKPAFQKNSALAA